MKILWWSTGILGLLTTIPVLGALFAPFYKRSPALWRSIGNINDFEVGETKLVRYKNALPLAWSGLSSYTASWLRRVSDEEFVAFSINCTHLGCPVRWEPKAELFLCPCHGGVYKKDGSYAAGPPPFGLPKYPVRIKDNMVQIQTSPIPITTL